MTIEEAHGILSNGLANAPSEHEWCVAFQMAIKALEALDKIRRAEIESIENYATDNGHDIWLRTRDEIKKEVLAILDKYTAESEDKE